MRRSSSNQRRMPLSRRQVLSAAATAGVGIAAVGAVGIANARETGPAPGGGARADDDAGQAIVVHLRDPGSGILEVFAGDARVEIRDRDLASRLAAAARRR